MDYNEIEYKILIASETFAKEHGVEFNELHKSMMINAMREVNHQIQKKNTTLNDGEYAILHDIYYELSNESLDKNGLLDIYLLLPEDIKADGLRWGLDDSVVRDNLYLYLKETLKTT